MKSGERGGDSDDIRQISSTGFTGISAFKLPSYLKTLGLVSVCVCVGISPPSAHECAFDNVSVELSFFRKTIKLI